MIYLRRSGSVFEDAGRGTGRGWGGGGSGAIMSGIGRQRTVETRFGLGRGACASPRRQEAPGDG
eukprot:scaffold4810_cov112-Isochrysis_galbana.AAC.5